MLIYKKEIISTREVKYFLQESNFKIRICKREITRVNFLVSVLFTKFSTNGRKV